KRDWSSDVCSFHYENTRSRKRRRNRNTRCRQLLLCSVPVLFFVSCFCHSPSSNPPTDEPRDATLCRVWSPNRSNSSYHACDAQPSEDWILNLAGLWRKAITSEAFRSGGKIG